MPLCMKDKLQLERWIAGGASLDEVERAPRFGLVDNERFTERARRAFVLLWAWSAPRYHGRAGTLQTRYYADHGTEGLMRRINRVRRYLGLQPL